MPPRHPHNETLSLGTTEGVAPVFCTGAIVFCSLGTAIGLALARGQDFNWDQQNYHLGIPWLLEHGTFQDSVAPAAIQSWFNPYVIEAQFWAMNHLSPKLFAVTLACVQSLAFMIAGLICATIPRSGSKRENTILALLGFALCLAAPVSLSEIGTTFIDLVTAIPVLAAFTLLQIRRKRNSGNHALFLSAGLLLGAAAALKLTNAIFAIASVGFIAGGEMRLHERANLTLLLYGAAAVGFFAVGGAWYYAVWKNFGNPFFPYYNNIFHSPDYSLGALRDGRFLPQSVVDIWRYPVFWLLGGSPNIKLQAPSSEVAFIDPRWALAVFGLTLLPVLLVVLRRWAHKDLPSTVTGLLVTFAIGYSLWLFEFGVHRYLVPLDILCGAIVLALVAYFPSSRLRIGLMAALVVGTLSLIRVPDWGHLPWSAHWQPEGAEIIRLPPHSLVFLTDKPSLMLALSLPPDTRYAGISSEFDMNATNDTRLTRRLRQEVALRPVMKEEDQGVLPAGAGVVLASYGLKQTDKCVAVISGNRPFRICDVQPLTHLRKRPER